MPLYTIATVGENLNWLNKYKYLEDFSHKLYHIDVGVSRAFDRTFEIETIINQPTGALVLENEKKRKLLILKPEYLAVFIGDMKNIMKYAESSQYIDQNTKRGYNPKITGV